MAWDGPREDESYTAEGSARGYTNHEHLDPVGLIHMNGRVYSPELGRFLSPDPIIQAPYYSQSYNRYAYVFNNPLRFVDPSGYTAVDDYNFDDYNSDYNNTDRPPREDVYVSGSQEDALAELKRLKQAMTDSNNVIWARMGSYSYNIATWEGQLRYSIASQLGALRASLVRPKRGMHKRVHGSIRRTLALTLVRE